MDDELTPEQKFAAEDAETFVPRALLLGKKPDEIVADLIKLDWSPAAAKAFVDRVIEDIRQFRESPLSRQRLINSAFNQFIGGLLFSLVSVVVALLGFWIIALLVFFGSLVAAGRGWSRWRLYKNWQQRVEQAELRDRESDEPSL